jgi:hypothetical protein
MFILGQTKTEGLSSYKPSSSLSCDRSISFSKLSSPKSAILSFLFQLPVSSSFLKVIQQLLTSPSLPSCPYNLSFSNLECSSYAICAQSSWPSFVLLCEECSFPPLLRVLLLHYLRGPSNLSASFSSATFHNSPGTSDLVSEESKFPHHTKLCSKCSTSLFSALALNHHTN